jgi:hypothetical protein
MTLNIFVVERWTQEQGSHHKAAVSSVLLPSLCYIEHMVQRGVEDCHNEVGVRNRIFPFESGGI